MYETERELQEVRIVKSGLSNDLINIVLEIYAGTRFFNKEKKLSKKNKQKLHVRLRETHDNLQAVKEAERILVEDCPFSRSLISEVIDNCRSIEQEKRDTYRERLYDMFHSKALDNNMPADYLYFIRLFLNELFARLKFYFPNHPAKSP